MESDPSGPNHEIGKRKRPEESRESSACPAALLSSQYGGPSPAGQAPALFPLLNSSSAQSSQNQRPILPLVCTLEKKELLICATSWGWTWLASPEAAEARGALREHRRPLSPTSSPQAAPIHGRGWGEGGTHPLDRASDWRAKPPLTRPLPRPATGGVLLFRNEHPLERKKSEI